MDQSCTNALRNFSPFALTEHIKLRYVDGLPCMNYLLQLLPQHFYRIKNFDLPNQKTLTFFCFNHSFEDQLVCLESVLLQDHFLLSFSLWKNTLTFSCRICRYNSEFIVPSMIASSPGPKAAKHVQIMKPWAWDMVLMQQCSVWISSNIMLFNQAFCFSLICQQNILPIAFLLIHVISKL